MPHPPGRSGKAGMTRATSDSPLQTSDPSLNSVDPNVQQATSPESLVAQGWKARDTPGFMGVAGPLWTRRTNDSTDDSGRWQYGLLIQAHHLNAVGIVHGGALTTLIDHAVSLRAWSYCDRQPCVTVDLSTHFVGAARQGEFLVASAEVTHATRSLVFLRGMIHVDDRPVLQTQAIMKRMRS